MQLIKDHYFGPKKNPSFRNQNFSTSFKASFPFVFCLWGWGTLQKGDEVKLVESLVLQSYHLLMNNIPGYMGINSITTKQTRALPTL